jgi:RNA polymerase sigma-32 factor
MSNTMSARIPPIGDINAYMRAIDTFPLLTLEEEQAAGMLKDDESINKLVTSHLRLAASIARKFFNNGAEFADLIQEANIGLLKAANRFDPSKGRFSSIATSYIHSQILQCVMDNHSITRIALTKPHRKMYFNLPAIKRKVLADHGRSYLTPEEVANVAQTHNVSENDVREMEVRLATKVVSFSTAYQSDDGADEGLGEKLPDSNYDPLVMLMNAEREYFETTGVQEAFELLNDREKFIIRNRFMVDKKMNFADLGAIFGVSAQRADQISRAAVKKMRDHLSEYVDA